MCENCSKGSRNWCRYIYGTHRWENRCLFPTFYDMENQFWAGLGSRIVLVKKKAWGQLGATFEGSFFMFSGPKKYLKLFQKYCSIHIKKLHTLFYSLFFFWIFWFYLDQNRLNIHNQLCLALLETPLCRTSIQWLCHVHDLESSLGLFPCSDKCYCM